jgi:hypothetical protein
MTSLHIIFKENSEIKYFFEKNAFFNITYKTSNNYMVFIFYIFSEGW